jgi:hypothetical protein
MKLPAKSVIIGRMPRVNDNEFKTLFVKVFDVKMPQTTEAFPKEELTFENIEKVVFDKCIPVYYLEGNDLILDDISEIEIIDEGSVVRITC